MLKGIGLSMDPPMHPIHKHPSISMAGVSASIYVCMAMCHLTGSYYGIVIDDERDVLSNLRFADDVLLFAQTLADAQKMVADFWQMLQQNMASD